MELWVRTQDKMQFLKVNDFYIGDVFTADVKNKELISFGVDFGIWTNNRILLASYPTKERCLEIIDEIQNILCRSGMILFKNVDISEIPKEELEPFKALEYRPKGDNQSKVSVHNAELVVYEMPEK